MDLELLSEHYEEASLQESTHPKQTQFFYCYISKLNFVSTCSFIWLESEQPLVFLLSEHTRALQQ